jgi:hypothetical protein
VQNWNLFFPVSPCFASFANHSLTHFLLLLLNKKKKKDSCVFSHPHENARRRDPRTHAYVPEPCPDYRHAGLCLLGNACPFSHGGKREGDFDFVFF